MLSGQASLRCLNELDVLYQEEMTTKGLPMCGGDLHWGTAGPSAIPEWAPRQVSRHSLVKQAASQWLWCLELFTAELSRRRWGSHVSHPPYSPTSLWLLLEQITWPESWVSMLRFGHWLFMFFSRCSGWWVYCICLVHAALWHMRALHID